MVQEDTDRKIIMLPKGYAIKPGDEIVIHPTPEGEWITHGNSKIGVGDEVVVVRLKDGDLAALNGAINSYRDCPLIHHVTHDQSIQNDPPHADSYFRKKYIIHLERAIKRNPNGGWPPVHLRLDFDVKYNNEGFQCWHPYGGVWLAVSPDNKEWYWCAGTGNPYLTIRGPPMWQGNANGENQFCVTNWLGGCPLCCPPPFSEINYLQVYISSQSSEYFGGFVKTRLLYTTICEGELREGWCKSLRDHGVRDSL